jgi:hypothetical protein
MLSHSEDCKVYILIPIHNTISDEDLRKYASKNCIKTIKKHFIIETISAFYYNLYDNIVR